MLLIATVAGLVVGFRGGSEWEVKSVILGPIVLALVADMFVRERRRRRSAAPDLSGPLSDNALSELFVGAGLNARRLVLSIGAVLLATGIAIMTTYMHAPSLAVGLGAGLTFFLRKHRGKSGFRAALAFVGLPLAVYGTLASSLLWWGE